MFHLRHKKLRLSLFEVPHSSEIAQLVTSSRVLPRALMDKCRRACEFSTAAHPQCLRFSFLLLTRKDEKERLSHWLSKHYLGWCICLLYPILPDLRMPLLEPWEQFPSHLQSAANVQVLIVGCYLAWQLLNSDITRAWKCSPGIPCMLRYVRPWIQSTAAKIKKWTTSSVGFSLLHFTPSATKHSAYSVQGYLSRHTATPMLCCIFSVSASNKTLKKATTTTKTQSWSLKN